MADEDSSWMLDDDAFPNDSAAAGADDGDQDSQETNTSAAPVEAPKPPAEWRKTYKHDVSIISPYIGSIWPRDVIILHCNNTKKEK